MKTFVGLDFHKRFSYGTIMAEDGRILKQGRLANDPRALEAFLGPHGGPQCAAVLEATRNWHVMHDWLEARTGEVVLAHPLKLRAIAEAAVKTDKIDATLLAHLLRTQLVPRAHVSSARARVIRRLLRHRIFLVRVRTMVKNRTHDLLDRHPLVRAEWAADELFSRAGVGWMTGIELPQADRLLLDSDLDMLAHLNEQIGRLEKMLSGVGRSDRRVRRLKTIPGIGPFISMLLVAEIDDLSRFGRVEKLHAYAGLIPTTHASGGKVRHGRVVATCNKYLRWAMIEAVWPAIRKDPTLRRFYERLAGRKGANTAKVATARRLLTIAYRVLKEDRDYRA